MKLAPFRNRIALIGVSSLAMASAGFAQTVTQPTPDAAAVPAADIVVTAQRRSEKLRDVPIAITALSADSLSRANITNTTELAKLTPGLNLPLYGAYVLPSIRGISSSGTSSGDSPNVAIYIDGVYQPSTSSVLADLPNIQSVQVLKGPQGSLYGQNAAGGAIIVDTFSPTFDWRGKATLSYGNYDNKLAQGYVSGPLTDTLAFALSGSYHHHDGYAHDILRGGHDKGLRSEGIFGKLLWQVSPETSFKLQGYISKRGDTGPYASQLYNGNGVARIYTFLPCAFGGLACQNLPQTTNKRDFANNIQGDAITRSRGVSLIGKIGVGGAGTVSTVAAYDVVKTHNFADIDGTAVNLGDFDFRVKGHSYIGEVNFVSNKFGGFTLTTGAFFLDRREGYNPVLFNARYSFLPGTTPSFYPALPTPFPYSGDPNSYYGDLHKTSYAIYGELSYEISEKLTATISGRYSREKQRVSNTPVIGVLPASSPALLPDPRGSFTFSKFTPRAVLRYKADSNNTFYISYSQGFKSGFVDGSNLRCVDIPGNTTSCISPPVKPEVVYAYEGGYKGHLARGLDLNLSVFHYDYKNIQVFVYNPVLGSRYENAATGKITGADLDLTYRASPDLTLAGGVSYVHGRYGSFPGATVYNPNACSAATFGLVSSGTCGNTQVSQNVAGNRLLRTPTWTSNVSANWGHDVSFGRIGAYVGASYNSGFFFDPSNRIGQNAYTLLDAELSISPSAIKGLRLSVWGKNLTNKTYLLSVLETQLADQAAYAEPRTFGVKAEFQF